MGRRVLIIGVIGKPNSGKSTFFSAATLSDVPIADYPFTTIEPNVGVTYASTPCVCRELGVKDNPVNSLCVNGTRMIPVKMIDVAGLIPGASRGLGLGNRFLDDIRKADVILHIVDASGSTDSEGKPVEPGSHNPAEDVRFVEEEYEAWMRSIVEKEWARITKRVDRREAISDLEKRLSGLGVSRDDILAALRAAGLEGKQPTAWANALGAFVHELRRISKPILVVANKVDMPSAAAGLRKLEEAGVDYVPASALSELILRKAAKSGAIEYLPGDPDFKIADSSKLNKKQLRALELVRERVLRVYGGTGVQQAINKAVFDLLGMIVVYPVEDESRFTDKDGRVLPDAFLVKRGTTARELAYIVHTELGESFLYAIDAKRKVKVGADYQLKHNDVIKIVAARRR